jgi:hypothetical protein
MMAPADMEIQPPSRRHPLVVERDRQTVQSDGVIILHHTDDLLTQDANRPFELETSGGGTWRWGT